MQVITIVEEDHQISFGLSGENESSNVFDVVVAVASAVFKSVYVVFSLHVDTRHLVHSTVGLQLKALVLKHNVLVRVDELLDHLVRNEISAFDHPLFQLSIP